MKKVKFRDKDLILFAMRGLKWHYNIVKDKQKPKWVIMHPTYDVYAIKEKNKLYITIIEAQECIGIIQINPNKVKKIKYCPKMYIEGEIIEKVFYKKIQLENVYHLRQALKNQTKQIA